MGVLAWTFFHIGLVFFGGGFVVIPVIQAEVVDRLGWLTVRQCVDGIAISQLTPGPVAMLSTFVGYHQQGVLGALLATVMIFLPSTVLMLFLSSGYRRWRSLPLVDAALAGVVPAVVGLVAAAGLQIGVRQIGRWQDVVWAGVVLTLLVRFKVNPAFLILGSAALGMLLRW